MEALALLCTLHADGPATLRRLKARGVHAVDALDELAIAELEEILGSDRAGAERFLREGRLLFDESLSDLESGSVGTEAAVESEPVEAWSAARTTPAVPAVSAESGGQEAEGSHRRRRYVLHPDHRDVPEALAIEIPAEKEPTPLQEGLFAGLDREITQVLADAGVATAEELAQAAAIDLAVELGMPYDRLHRLKQLAAEHLGWDGEVTPDLRASTGRGLEERDGGSSAGPFA